MGKLPEYILIRKKAEAKKDVVWELCEGVDVVPIVRCKDCRHRDQEDHKCDSGQTERAGCVFPVSGGYFCAYGERKKNKERKILEDAGVLFPVETNIYDEEELHHNCTVQILRNSITGETSIGWWEEE